MDCGVEMPLSFYRRELERAKERMLLEFEPGCALGNKGHDSG
ncbi:MAG: hypothetical protein ACLFSY_03035 [Desulfonatronovibrionaceae bacterium]